MGVTVTATTGDKFDAAASPVNLGPLQNNGGPTKTMALLAGSTALDAGDDCVTDVAHCGDANTPQLTTDQRGAGFSRSVDGPDADVCAVNSLDASERGKHRADAMLTGHPIDADMSEHTPKIRLFAHRSGEFLTRRRRERRAAEAQLL